MSNNRARINQQLFGQLSSIYTQLGQPIPNRGPSDQGGGGAYTAWLQSAISTGQGLLDQKRLTELADQLKPPKPPEPIQAPIEIQSQNRSRLGTESRARRSRSATRRGRRNLTTGLNVGGGGSTSGGVSF